MINAIIKVFEIMFPVIVAIGLGFGLCKLKFPWSSKHISPIILKIGLPCLIISRFSSFHSHRSDILIIMLCALIAIASYTVISFIVVEKMLKLPRREYLAGFIFTTMSCGLPICYYAYGHTGLALALGFAAVMLIFQFTMGAWIPDGRISFRSIFKIPFIYAVAFALIIMLTGIKLPVFIDKSFLMLGDLAIPLLLLTLGFSLAEIKVTRLLPAFAYAFIHLLISGSVGIGIIYLIGLQGELRGVFLLLSFMPSATINLLLSRRAGVNDEGLAGFIFASTCFLLLSMPVVLIFLFN